MKRLLFGSILLINQFIFSQNTIQTDIKGKKIDYYFELEKKLGSKIYKTDKEYISVKPVIAPFVFERKEKEIPNLLVFYKLYKEDSAIAEILYEWDVRNFEKGDNINKSLSFNKAMIKKYYKLVDEISKKYGDSQYEGNLEKLELLNSEEGLSRRDNWQVNDKFKVFSYINLSEYYESNGLVTTIPTHRIRFYVINEEEK